ncbi:MAG: hypothetical protein ACREOF_18225 [Gemmatimonadales bacterium]
MLQASRCGNVHVALHGAASSPALSCSSKSARLGPVRRVRPGLTCRSGVLPLGTHPSGLPAAAAAVTPHQLLTHIAATRRLFTPYVRRGASGQPFYGYGWQIRRDSAGSVINHTGGNGVVFADLRWFVEPDVVVVMADNAFSAERASRLVRAVRSAVRDRRPEAARLSLRGRTSGWRIADSG